MACILSIAGSAFAQSPIVVELFTSEGCSSCPPADAVLLDLSRQSGPNGTDLILLGEHVDYWNYIGWTDRFSSAQFSQRQGDYARILHLEAVYTPQMVIDGHEQFVGNDAANVREKISQAAKQAKPDQVALQWEGNDRLRVSVRSPSSSHAKVLLAITEEGLTTAVKNGENGGKTLHHAAVVRQLRELGVMNKDSFVATADVGRHADWNAAQMKVAVLVQDAGTGKIVGAAAIAYPHEGQ
jgi:hypothetical protein